MFLPFISRQRTVRNSDFVEVTVVENDQIHFRGAFIYGFKNIQNLVMKMKVCYYYYYYYYYSIDLIHSARSVYMMWLK